MWSQAIEIQFYSPAQWAAHAVTHWLPDKNVIWGRGLCRLSRLATRVRGKRQTRLPFVSGAFCMSICSALVMNGGSCSRRGGAKGRGGLEAAWLPACLACGCNCNCNWESHELCKHWQNPQSFSSQIQFFQAASTNKQIVCYYRWVALPDRVIAQD